MRELFREFVIAREGHLDRHDERMTLAWTIAGLSNAKKLPKLSTLLSRQKRQTPADQKAVIQSIADYLGKRLVKRKRKATEH